MTKHIKGHTTESAWNTAAYLLGCEVEDLKWERGTVSRTYTGPNGWLSILSGLVYEVNLNNGDSVILWIK